MPNDAGDAGAAVGWVIDDRACTVAIDGEFAAYRTPDGDEWALAGILREPLPMPASVEATQGTRRWEAVHEGHWWVMALPGASSIEPACLRFVDSAGRLIDDIEFRLRDLVSRPTGQFY